MHKAIRPQEYVDRSRLTRLLLLTCAQRTAPSISAPPVVVKEADRMSEELNALGNTIDNKGHPVGKYHSCKSHDIFLESRICGR